MNVKMKSKTGGAFFRLGKQLTPDEWVEVDLGKEAAKRGTSAEQLLGQLMKSAIPVIAKREPTTEDGVLGKVIPNSGGGAIDLEPVDEEARGAMNRILKRREQWSEMTAYQRIAVSEVLAAKAREEEEVRKAEALEQARAWSRNAMAPSAPAKAKADADTTKDERPKAAR